jgi:SAM-dependent methyltransferase
MPTASAEPSRPTLGTVFDPAGPLLAHNRLTIAGWASSAGELSSVKVRIAGREFTASYGLPTPAGVVGLPAVPDEDHAGFELALDTTRWAPGSYPFEVVATDAGGIASVAGVADVQPYEQPPLGDAAVVEALAEGRPAMWCEYPDLFVTREGEAPLEVSGFATSPAGIERVMVTVDGWLRIDAVHGLVRPDLRSRLGDAAAADCGFAVRLDPAECPLGWHELTVVAITRDGRGLGVSGMVECLPPGRSKQASASAPEPMTPDADDDELDLLSSERFVPDMHHGKSLEPEHHARYGWAASHLAGLEVLDAGCGVGWGTALLAERAKRATGIDISPVAVAEATRRHGDVAVFEPGDLRRVPFDDGEFDAVVSFEAIEHVADAEQALDELRRVLRPGGLLLISTPNRGVYPEGNPFHHHEFTAEEFEASLAARFENVAVYRQHTYIATLLGTDRALGLDDPAVTFEAEVAKVCGGPPGSELYTVVAASDGELPPDPVRIVLGRALDVEEQEEKTRMWQDRAVHAEADAAASRMEAHFARRMQRHTLERVTAGAAPSPNGNADANGSAGEASELELELERAWQVNAALQDSLSWRLTAPLRGAKRLFGGRR